MTDFTLFGLTEEDMIERLDQALIDSMEYDWRCIDGARAVMEEIKCWVADQGPNPLTLFLAMSCCDDAQGIEARQGGDGNRLHRNDESPVAESDAPKPNRRPHDQA
jgi:hypothetical protein